MRPAFTFARRHVLHLLALPAIFFIEFYAAILVQTRIIRDYNMPDLVNLHYDDASLVLTRQRSHMLAAPAPECASKAPCYPAADTLDTDMVRDTCTRPEEEEPLTFPLLQDVERDILTLSKDFLSFSTGLG